MMSEIALEISQGYSTSTDEATVPYTNVPSAAPLVSDPRYRIGIDSTQFNNKPEDRYAVSAIKARLANGTTDATLAEFITAIKQGQTVCPAYIDGSQGSHAAKYWQSQQIFCIDIDNAIDKVRVPDDKYISTDKARQLLKDNGIKAFFIYRSFSDKQNFSKFRICVRLDSLVTDTTEREHIIKALIALFGEAADKSCTNADRIFFGSRANCSIYEDTTAVTSKSTLLALYDKLFPTVNAPVPKALSSSIVPVPTGGWSKAYDYDIDALLYCINPDCVYSDWFDATAAYKGAGGNIDTWAQWSAQSPKWKESDRKRWNGIGGTGREHLIKLAGQTAEGTAYMDGLKQAQAEAKKQYKTAKKGGEWGKRIAPDTSKEEETISFNGKVMTKTAVRDFIKQHPFLDGTETTCKINPVRLYDFFLKDRHFIFVSSERSSDVRIFEYRKGVYVMIDERRLKGEIDAVIKKNNAGGFITTRAINEVYTLITYEKDFMVNESSINSDENIINFRNGILHLDTMELTAHSPSVLSTIQIPCEWHGEQPTPLFDAFMATFTGNNEDKIRLFLEFMGGGISNVDGTRHFKKALFVVGKSNSGKSVLRNLLTELIGKHNQSGASLARLEDRFGAMELYQRRMVGSPDLGYPSIKQAEIFKNVTGGDFIPIEQKNQPMFQYRYQGFMWFGCNRLPKFPPDTATYNRMIIVECSNVIPEEERDSQLIPKLLTEASGIVYKAVIAIKAAVERGRFTIPAESNELMKSYRIENSIYMQFYDECCEKRPRSAKGEQPIFNDNVTAATILTKAKEWLMNNYPSSKFAKSTFKRELEAEGVDMTEYRTSKARYFSFTLSDEAKVEFGIPVQNGNQWGKSPTPTTAPNNDYDDYGEFDPYDDNIKLPF